MGNEKWVGVSGKFQPPLAERYSAIAESPGLNHRPLVLHESFDPLHQFLMMAGYQGDGGTVLLGTAPYCDGEGLWRATLYLPRQSSVLAEPVEAHYSYQDRVWIRLK